MQKNPAYTAWKIGTRNSIGQCFPSLRIPMRSKRTNIAVNAIAITNEFKALKPDNAWAFSKEKYETYSHNYHRYPAKFISPLADKLIQQESERGECVVDIFGGCGTTLLQAKLLGRESYGFDINPVAQLISEVKTKPLPPEKLADSFAQLEHRIKTIQSSNRLYDYDNTHERIRYWFSPSCYQELGIIYDAILRENNPHIQKFFICGFSHCLKNSSRWLMKSIKPTIDRNKEDNDVISCFKRHIKKMINKNTLFYRYLKDNKQLETKSKLFLSDITTTQRRMSADLIITSPPYVTSYEYADLHQLTVLWLGVHAYPTKWKDYLKNHQQYKGKFIGSNVKQNESYDEINSFIGDNIVQQLMQKNKALADKVSTYYYRMNTAFAVMHKMLNKHRKACIVIGNTKLLGVDIRNAEVALEQLLRNGFAKEEIIKRNANTNKMITPYRDRATGKFTSKHSSNKRMAYSTEYVIKVVK